jgi:hypothetical protein
MNKRLFGVDSSIKNLLTSIVVLIAEKSNFFCRDSQPNPGTIKKRV